jgi:hypothetical protein
MINWPVAFGSEVRQYIVGGEHMVEQSYSSYHGLEGRKIKRGRGQGPNVSFYSISIPLMT